jgi:hypothetical protein
MHSPVPAAEATATETAAAEAATAAAEATAATMETSAAKAVIGQGLSPGEDHGRDHDDSNE